MRGTCPHCGRALLPTAAVCPHCGATVARGTPPPRTNALATTVPDPEHQPLAPEPTLGAPPGRVGPPSAPYAGPTPRVWVACLLSALFPGAGQAYVGHIGVAVALALTWWLVPVLSNVVAALHAAGAARRAALELREPRGEWAAIVPAFQILVQAPLLVVLVSVVLAAVMAGRAAREADARLARQLPRPEALGGLLSAGESKVEGLVAGPAEGMGRAEVGESAPGGPAGALPLETRNRLSRGVVFLVVDRGDGWVGEGTGIIVSEDGLIVTNAHVAAYGESARIGAVLDSGGPAARVCEAGLVWAPRRPTDAQDGAASMETLAGDLALLRLDPGGVRLTPLSLGRSEDIVETAEVLSVGFPLGTSLQAGSSGPAPSFVRGNITRLQRDDTGRVLLIEHSAPILGGYSGGPLVTSQGLVVGINAGVAGEKIAGAVPAERATELLTGGSR